MLRITLLILVWLLLPFKCFAKASYGTTLSYSLMSTEPDTLRGMQFMFNYDPQKFQWRQFNIFFSGGVSYFWVTSTSYYSSLNIYSIAPIIRYLFKRHWIFHPYFDLSIGLAYLNHTRIDNRNLGIHFAFQDMLGAGMFLGHSDTVSLGFHALHYSNAHFSQHNSGISLPIVLDLGIRF